MGKFSPIRMSAEKFTRNVVFTLETDDAWVCQRYGNNQDSTCTTKSYYVTGEKRMLLGSRIIEVIDLATMTKREFDADFVAREHGTFQRVKFGPDKILSRKCFYLGYSWSHTEVYGIYRLHDARYVYLDLYDRKGQPAESDDWYSAAPWDWILDLELKEHPLQQYLDS